MMLEDVNASTQDKKSFHYRVRAENFLRGQ